MSAKSTIEFAIQSGLLRQARKTKGNIWAVEMLEADVFEALFDKPVRWAIREYLDARDASEKEAKP